MIAVPLLLAMRWADRRGRERLADALLTANIAVHAVAFVAMCVGLALAVVL